MAASEQQQQQQQKKMTGYQLWEEMGSPKYVVAPMVDQSELAFRMMCRKYEPSTLCYTPMIHARLFNEDKHYENEFFTTCEGDRPLFVQFCGNDPATLLAAAKRIEDKCDAVDLNLGCPQQIARRGNYGAFLAEDLPRVLEIVSTLDRGLSVPVACKIRVQDKLEDTLAYAKALVEAGCRILCVHGRTRECGRHGLADWDAIRAVKESLDIPVIANGNIRSLDDCHACLRATGCDAVMSAETLLENPALFHPLPTVARVLRPLPNGSNAASTTRVADGADTATGQRLMLPPWDLATEYCDFARKYMRFKKNTPHLGMVRAHLFKILHQELSRWPDLREGFAQQGLGCADPSPLYDAVTAVRDRALQHMQLDQTVEGQLKADESVDGLPVLVPFKTRAEVATAMYGGEGRHPRGAIKPTGVNDDTLEDADMGGLFGGDDDDDEWGDGDGDCCSTETEQIDSATERLEAARIALASITLTPTNASDVPPGFFESAAAQPVSEEDGRAAAVLPNYAVLNLPYDDRYGEAALQNTARLLLLPSATAGPSGSCNSGKCFLVRRSNGEPHQCLTLSYTTGADSDVSHTRIVLDTTQPEDCRVWMRWKDDVEYEAKSVEAVVEMTAARDGFVSVGAVAMSVPADNADTP
jgi:tRNA-dihydrouridine synthase 1